MSSRSTVKFSLKMLHPHNPQKSPIFSQKSPTYLQKSLTFSQKSPVYLQKSPIFHKRALYNCKRAQYFHQKALYFHKRALYICKRAIHLDRTHTRLCVCVHVCVKWSHVLLRKFPLKILPPRHPPDSRNTFLVQIQIKAKSQYEFVKRNLKMNLYRKIPRNLSFSIGWIFRV